MTSVLCKLERLRFVPIDTNNLELVTNWNYTHYAHYKIVFETNI